MPKNRLPQIRTADEVRGIANALPGSYDAAVESAMMNAFDLGLSEEADDDGLAFWTSVLGEVTA